MKIIVMVPKDKDKVLPKELLPMLHAVSLICYVISKDETLS
jgi:hypothetical protein